MKACKSSILFLGLLITVIACSQEPEEIHYGSDECTHCKMMITDNRFASQIVTETGKSLKFDAIECMAQYSSEHKPTLGSSKFWVTDFSQPGTWIEINNAKLVQSEVVNSPMGASLLALDSEESLKKHLTEYPGQQVSWEQLVK